MVFAVDPELHKTDCQVVPASKLIVSPEQIVVSLPKVKGRGSIESVTVIVS